MLPSYWKKIAWRLYSNWIMGVAGAMQAAAMTVKQTGIVIPAPIDQACGYAIAGMLFVGIFLRGVAQTSDTAATDTTNNPPLPDTAPAP